MPATAPVRVRMLGMHGPDPPARGALGRCRRLRTLHENEYHPPIVPCMSGKDRLLLWEFPPAPVGKFPIGTHLERPWPAPAPRAYLVRMPPDRGAYQEEVQAYYRVVSRFIDRELVRRGDAEFWRSAAGEPDVARVLELGAGTGRITELLAERAARVVGVDLSREMLAKARSRLSGHEHVHLMVADMRTLALGDRFDLVVAADDPFVHLNRSRDRQRTLEVVKRHLAPGGRFVLDAHRLSRRRVRDFHREGEYVRERTVGPESDELRIREHWTWIPETTRCLARYEYLREGTVVAEASFRARLWTVEELEERLPRAGLEVRHLWGDYDRSPFDAASSRHLLVEAVHQE